MYFSSVYKIFWGPKGGFERTPSNPPCLRACIHCTPVIVVTEYDQWQVQQAACTRAREQGYL